MFAGLTHIPPIRVWKEFLSGCRCQSHRAQARSPLTNGGAAEWQNAESQFTDQHGPGLATDPSGPSLSRMAGVSLPGNRGVEGGEGAVKRDKMQHNGPCDTVHLAPCFL